MHKHLYHFILSLLALTLLLTGCGESPEPAQKEIQTNSDGKITVGFSQMNHLNPWRVAETNDLKGAADRYGIELILLDAESSRETQIEHIKELAAMGVDYIICAPIVETGWGEAFKVCREAGIPLIMIDREAVGVPGEDFLTFVGSDFEEEAVRAALWLEERIGSTAKIVELKGREGASCVRDRAKGFRDVIADIPGMEIVVSEFADFERITGQIVMEEIILTYGKDFDAVYAHNDEMAIGAIQALKAADMVPGEEIMVVSIDGSHDALKSIMAGTLGATVECTPFLADEVFTAIKDHAAGKTIPHEIIVEDRLFDDSNAEEYIDEVF